MSENYMSVGGFAAVFYSFYDEYIHDLIHVLVFVTPSYGRQLLYLPKSYMLLQSCYIGCAVKDKVYPVFENLQCLLQCSKHIMHIIYI